MNAESHQAVGSVLVGIPRLEVPCSAVTLDAMPTPADEGPNWSSLAAEREERPTSDSLKLLERA